MGDGAEGWITVKGNAGTVFAEVVQKYYAITKESEMNKKFEEGGEMLRSLEAGEAIQILEGPKDQNIPAEMRIKVRSVTDRSSGWVSKNFVKKWNPTYTVRVAVPLQETSAVTEETKTVVELAKGDKVQYLEGPIAEGTLIRLKGKAMKDGSVG